MQKKYIDNIRWIAVAPAVFYQIDLQVKIMKKKEHEKVLNMLFIIAGLDK